MNYKETVSMVKRLKDWTPVSYAPSFSGAVKVVRRSWVEHIGPLLVRLDLVYGMQGHITGSTPRQLSGVKDYVIMKRVYLQAGFYQIR